MPAGGGNISLNVWTTKDDLLFYIGSSDSWIDGNIPGEVANVKISRVRLNISPNPFGRDFRQELDLATNSIRVSGKTTDGISVNLKIWVDAFNPVVHVEGDASDPVNATVQVETWRGDTRFDDNAVVWSHRTEGPSRARAASIYRQGIQNIESAVPDPIKNLTFGGCLSGTGMVSDGQSSGGHEGQKYNGWRLRTAQPVRQFNLQATLRIEQDPNIGEWEQALYDLDSVSWSNVDLDRRNTEEWWRSFWDRSHIIINSGKPESDPAWQVGRNYQLFRAMLGTNRSGRMPTLFNGGAFLCEPDPDQRQWGQAGFTAQNQRLVYWPMLKSGDEDMLRVALDFYAKRLPVELAWARHFWDVEGAVFPEDIDVFGMTVRLARKDGTCTPECLQYHWTSGMEFALMMLETWRYNASDIKAYIPVAISMLHFYDQFYRKQNLKNSGTELDPQGRLVIYPGNGLEVYSGARNDAAALSGLMALSDGLLALPGEMLTTDEREFCQAVPQPSSLLSRHGCGTGIFVFLPLKPGPLRGWIPIWNCHSYTRYSLSGITGSVSLIWSLPATHGYMVLQTQPNKNLTSAGTREAYLQPAWDLRMKPGNMHLPSSSILHGLPREEKILQRSRYPRAYGNFIGWILPDGKYHDYPAFWDCMDFDQRPDMDHGGSAMIQLQEMLMQTAGDKIILLPAWPEEWDVDFKLHAPGNTIVECVYKNREVISLRVTPESKRGDIIIYN